MSLNKSFYSKILLFGEYSIIKNSMALSIPYPLFEGKLSFRRDNLVLIDPELKAFSLYLKKLISDAHICFDFDLSSFEFDISQGLFFDSTIPQGYGVGSSGALVAAIFERYELEKKELDVLKLKTIFSQMESHFHGSSSGIDPLISFLNSPILMKSKNDLGPVFIPKFNKGPGAIFLLNTKRPRKTEPLVNLFLEKCTNPSFNNLCETELKRITNQCIDDFLSGHLQQTFLNFKELSLFQHQNFLPMIPKLFQEDWKLGLENDCYYLKLCGAGGGGFLLGITQDFEKTKKLLSAHELRMLMSF